MVNHCKRSIAAVGLLAVAAGAALVGPGPAAAAPVESGSLTMTSDPGDWVGQGGSYEFSVAAGDSFNATASQDGTLVSVSVFPAGGSFWFVDLAAPRGEALATGTYTGATRAAFRAPGEPGIDVSGDGRGCNQILGSFSVNAIKLGPQGYVETFDANFEQHCEGFAPALQGHLVITNPPPPVELALGPTVTATGTASTLNGNATISGTVTCTQPAAVTVSGTLTQVAKRVLIRGAYGGVTVACTPGVSVPWQATAVPTGTTPFQKGDAEATVMAVGIDPFFGTQITATATGTVRLNKG
jgi:hypothetical protein